MSRRTVARFTLSTILAASLTAPAAGQLPVETRPRPYHLGPTLSTEPLVGVRFGRPEVAPMPREKDESAYRCPTLGPIGLYLDLDVPLNRGPFDRIQNFNLSVGLFADGDVPPAPAAVAPPNCAFDCRPACPVAAAPMPRPKDGPFDRIRNFTLGELLVLSTADSEPPAPAPVCPPTECRTPPCPAAAPPSRFVQPLPDYHLYLPDAPYPPVFAGGIPPVTRGGECPTGPRPVPAAGFRFDLDARGPDPFGFGPAGRLWFDGFDVPRWAVPQAALPRSAVPTVVYQCPPVNVPFPAPTGVAGEPGSYTLCDVSGGWKFTGSQPGLLLAAPPAAVPLPRVIVEVIGDYRPPTTFDGPLTFGGGFGGELRSFTFQLVRPLPAPAAYPPFVGPGYPPPLVAVPPCPTGPPAHWNPTPPPNVPAGDFALMADALGKMVGGAPSPFVRPAGGCAPADPLVTPAAPAVGGCCLPAPRADAPGGLCGTWVREVGPVVYVLKIAPDHLTVTVTAASEDDKKVSTEGMVLTADYHLGKDRTTVVGLITGMDAALDGPLPDGFDLPRFAEEVTRLQKALSDKPFALTVRRYADALVVGNVRLPEVADGPGSWCPLGMLGGRYAEATGKAVPKPRAVKVIAPPLPTGRNLEREYPQYFKPDPDSDRIPPPPPAATTPAAPPAPPVPAPVPPDAPAKGRKGKKKAAADERPLPGYLLNVYSSDPDERMRQLLYQSEDRRQVQNEWRRFWFNDQPAHLTPERIHGGIIGP